VDILVSELKKLNGLGEIRDGLNSYEDFNKNSLFFLAGTMVNVTYSIMIGFLVRILTGMVYDL